MRAKQLPVESPACHTRILALIPDADLNEARFAQCVGNLSAQHLAPVLLLTVVPHYAHEANARLRLALLAALLYEAGRAVEMEIVVAVDWLSVVGQYQREGDLILCHAEQGDVEPIQKLLQKAGLRVQEVRGYVTLQAAPSLLEKLLSWFVPLAIIFVVFGVQALVLRWASAWPQPAQHALLIFTLVAEVAAVMFFFNRE